jgi:copper ion binding protein
MSERTYVVTGMTCEHCVNAVTEEVGRVDGVQAVDVDLASGRVRVTGTAYSDAHIEEAIDEAGYELAGAGTER